MKQLEPILELIPIPNFRVNYGNDYFNIIHNGDDYWYIESTNSKYYFEDDDYSSPELALDAIKKIVGA